eukprot:349998-Chlamydomonas_euryale.AAC.2
MSESSGSSWSEDVKAVDTPASKRIKSMTDVATQEAGVKRGSGPASGGKAFKASKEHTLR